MTRRAVGFDAWIVGEALTDVLLAPDGKRTERPGGSPANVALGLARLGHRVELGTRIGDDRRGRLLLSRLHASGVTLSAGSVTDEPTPTATAALDADGAATYAFDFTWAPRAWDAPPGHPHLHTGSLATALAPGADVVRAAVARARPLTTVSYDPNPRPALLGPADRERPRVEQCVALSDVVKAGREDLEWLVPEQPAQDTARRWAGIGPALVVLTCGADGALAWWRGRSYAVPAPPTDVKDTVGAGDAFMTGLLSGLLRAGLLGSPAARRRLYAGGDDRAVTDALALAARAAAVTVARAGADPPTRPELGPPPAGIRRA
ncbi:PfkB family carbohydrate kinase [Streptomyces sp. NPDC047315]|uniref:PfkB family carbohydrate kinase n=1 Tax=Streptomyces sp. NPDC047315 TaxID=3155142 RepID=UPI0033C84689